MLIGSDTTSSTILSTLSQEPALTAKQVYIRFIRATNRPISYQAVHKHLLALCQTKVLEKTMGRYKINHDWIIRTEMFIQQVKMNNTKNAPINEEEVPICKLAQQYRKGAMA